VSFWVEVPAVPVKFGVCMAAPGGMLTVSPAHDQLVPAGVQASAPAALAFQVVEADAAM
jgi:hypothetical protein